MKKDIQKYATVVYDDEDMVSVRIPDFNIATFGTNETNAIDMAREAVSLYMDVEKKHPVSSDMNDVALEDWEKDNNAKIILVSYDLSMLDEKLPAFAYA